MCKTIQLPAVKSVPKKMLLRHKEPERFNTDPLIDFYNKTIAFFNNHLPGKLAKDLYKFIFALMEHQANNDQPANFSNSIYDIKQLLQLLEETDRLQQTGQLHTQQFFDMAVEFVYENNPTTSAATCVGLFLTLFAMNCKLVTLPLLVSFYLMC